MGYIGSAQQGRALPEPRMMTAHVQHVWLVLVYFYAEAHACCLTHIKQQPENGACWRSDAGSCAATRFSEGISAHPSLEILLVLQILVALQLFSPTATGHACNVWWLALPCRPLPSIIPALFSTILSKAGCPNPPGPRAWHRFSHLPPDAVPIRPCSAGAWPSAASVSHIADEFCTDGPPPPLLQQSPACTSYTSLCCVSSWLHWRCRSGNAT